MTDDFYCDEVLSGHTFVERVLETDNVLVFHHTRPYYPVHIVVIPKRHVESLLALSSEDDSLLLELFQVIQQVSAQLVAKYGGVHIVINAGKYQTSKHLHWHIGAGEPLR